MRERHGLGRALGAGREEDHRRGVGVRPRQAVQQSAGQHVGGQQRQRRFQLADAGADIFQEQVLGPFDLDAQPVDQFLRSDDVADAQRLDGVGQVGGAGRPVQQHRQLAGQVQAEENHVGRHRAGEQHADRPALPSPSGRGAGGEGLRCCKLASRIIGFALTPTFSRGKAGSNRPNRFAISRAATYSLR